MQEFSQTETEAAILEGVAQVLNAGGAGTAHRNSVRRIDRKAVATSMGLKDLGTEAGSCAVVLGTHDALPGMLVKVTSKEDGFVAFAEAWLEEAEYSDEMPDFFPKIYSVTYVGDFALVLVEKIEGRAADPGDVYSEEGYKTREAVLSWCFDHIHDFDEDGFEKFNPDLHHGNLIVRADGTHVWIDPVWNPEQD